MVFSFANSRFLFSCYVYLIFLFLSIFCLKLWKFLLSISFFGICSFVLVGRLSYGWPVFLFLVGHREIKEIVYNPERRNQQAVTKDFFILNLEERIPVTKLEFKQIEIIQLIK